MKALITSFVIFIVISAIAVFYQIHLTKISITIETYSKNIIDAANDKNFSAIEKNINELNIVWNKNKQILMMFHDHASVNTASSFLSLANNAFNSEDLNRISAEIIQFNAIISELTAENIPNLENIF